MLHNANFDAKLRELAYLEYIIVVSKKIIKEERLATNLSNKLYFGRISFGDIQLPCSFSISDEKRSKV